MFNNIMCVICRNNIDSTQINYVITECKHCFHTNCLMKNVTFNGYNCPICRLSIVNIIKDEDDDEKKTDEELDRLFIHLLRVDRIKRSKERLYMRRKYHLRRKWFISWIEWFKSCGKWFISWIEWKKHE